MPNDPFNELKIETEEKSMVTKEQIGTEGNLSNDTEETNIDQDVPMNAMEFQSVGILLVVHGLLH